MNNEKIEQIIKDLQERYNELSDWWEKKLWEAEVDIAYQMVQDFADKNGISFAEAWRILNLTDENEDEEEYEE